MMKFIEFKKVKWPSRIDLIVIKIVALKEENSAKAVNALMKHKSQANNINRYYYYCKFGWKTSPC